MFPNKNIRFDRNELAGAFGDIGTDLPLLVGVILAAKLDAASALVMFGAMQILTGFLYGMPMPVQPLKAMAALVIAQKLSGGVLFGAGLAIGFVMLFLTVTGLLEALVRVVPKTVVRGLQLGLGMTLVNIALKDYVGRDGLPGYCLALSAFLTILLLKNNRRFPAALIVIVAGIIYAFATQWGRVPLLSGFGFVFPKPSIPMGNDIIVGFLVLALPQIPLSLGNSVLATRQLAEDLFPDKLLTTKKIGFTYSIMNLINPFFGGIPTCHGSGGMAGHYAFGARTGGSVAIYGLFYLMIGLFFSQGFSDILNVFPMPILGIILFFEGLALLLLVRELSDNRDEFLSAIMIGLIAVFLPYGFLVGMVFGTFLYYLNRQINNNSI